MLQKKRHTSGKAVTMVWVAGGVQNLKLKKNRIVHKFVLNILIYFTYRFAKIIFSSCTECSLSTLTALTTVFPVPEPFHWIKILYLLYPQNILIILMIGYISKTFLWAMSSGNFAYTTLAFSKKVKMNNMLQMIDSLI